MKKMPSSIEVELRAPPNSTVFTYPTRLASACAEVLARLLAGESMTSADTLDDCDTMRAAAHVHYLRMQHGWPILSEEFVNGCRDGRLVTIARYRLSQDTIELARRAGADDWCAKVEQARAELRAKAHEAKAEAACRNAVARKGGYHAA